MNVLIYTGWPVKTWRIPSEQVARIRRELPDVNFAHATNADEATRDIVNVEASLSPWLTPAILEKATRLRWVHSSAPRPSTTAHAQPASRAQAAPQRQARREAAPRPERKAQAEKASRTPGGGGQNPQ